MRRRWVLFVAVTLVVATHALAKIIAEVEHGVFPSDQPITLPLADFS